MNGVKPKKERRLTAIFRQSDAAHCGGINSLLVSQDGQSLFSASRDATVKQWDITRGQPRLLQSFEEHVDWVNDIALAGSFLLTCSSDKTVKVWRSDGACVHTSASHSDCAMALAAAPDAQCAFSAGLRSEVIRLDLTSGASSQLYPEPPRPNGELDEAAKGSIYSVACMPDARALAAGTSGGAIVVIDPRSSLRVATLSGHTDNVRAVALSHDGSLLLSGSSDRTIRLWDMRHQRCVQSLPLHADSVWSLLVSDDFSTIYSGGRDRRVYRTQLDQGGSDLLLVEQQPIHSMALNPVDGALWVATPSSSINKWPTGPAAPGSPAGRTLKRPTSGRAVHSVAALKATKQSQEAAEELAVQHVAPLACIPGVPSIVQHRVLTDRQHILLRDSTGCVHLWDVLKGKVTCSYGPVDFETKAGELFRAISVANWFTADHKLGSLSLHLDYPAAFHAEIYGQDMGANVAEDVKYNYGLMLLRGLCKGWVLAHGGPQALQSTGPEGAVPETTPCPELASSARSPVIASTAPDGVPWAMPAAELPARLSADTLALPAWAADALLHGTLPPGKEGKAAFILLPLEGSELPSLLQSRLNAPKILQIRKVATFLCSKLAEQGLAASPAPCYYSLNTAAQRDAGYSNYAGLPPEAGGEPLPSGPLLELLCCGYAVPHNLTLAAVKKFIWRRSDDVIVHYRIQDSARPAPMPVIKPPDS